MSGKIKFSLSFLLLLGNIVLAQDIYIKGVVTDNSDSRPLAFVNIITDSGTGITSDIDGKFSIPLQNHDSIIRFTYIGYNTLEYKIKSGENNLLIGLSRKSYNLEQVNIFPGENPAHRIINNVIKNRNLNDPAKLNAFTYTSYDKMTIAIKADTLMSADTAVLDTTQKKIRNFLDKQDLFLMETVTERMYKYPGLNQENVIASRVSGFKDPLVTFMLSQLQSTSFYNEQINILAKEYINPISKGSTNKYFFLLEDTLYRDNQDTVFIISFRPAKGTRFNGMKGFLHINTNKWAIEKVKAEPQNDSVNFSVRIQQAYEQVDNHWFPYQLNTDIIFNTASIVINDTTFPLVAVGKSYIKDIDLNPDLKKSDFSFNEIEVNEDAGRKKGEFWQQYRVDSLTQKNKETYRVIDSIGKAENFDKIASTFQTLISGEIPVRFINIDIDRFIHFNNYEGLYLGVGAHTNQKLSKRISFGGYWGYGFRDKAAKYGGDIQWLFHKPSASKIILNAYNKVTPSGYSNFFTQRNQVWQTDNFYEFFFTQMNKTIGGSADLSFRIKAFRDITWYAGIEAYKKYPYKDYYYNSTGNPANDITTFESGKVIAGIRFAWHERVLQTPRDSISMGSDYPVVKIKYTRGTKMFGEGSLIYNRFDLSFSYTHKTKYLGNTQINLLGGWISEDLPISELFSNRASYSQFTVFAPQSFGTMRPNEFYSDKYISLFLSHNFKNLLFGTAKFSPELILLTNIGFGSMQNTGYHHNIDFKTLEKGYYESGIMLRKIISLQIYDIGAGVLYRYGPYGFDTVSLNFAYKLSLFFTF